jgi:hypothetical protein
MLVQLTRYGLSALFIAVLAACSNGGKLSLEPGARKVQSKGVPFVQINQGGKALIVESGKTATTGVHGWVAVQTMPTKTLTDVKGNQMSFNGVAAH